MRSTYLWFLQLVTGGLILVLAGIHLISMHLRVILNFFGVDSAGLTPWGLAANRAGQGLWTGLFVFLVAIILYHAFAGLRNTVLELVASATKVRIITWVIVVSGIILLLGTIFTPVVLFSG